MAARVKRKPRASSYKPKLALVARKKRERNPDEESGEAQAARLSELFHGRPAHEIRDYIEEVSERAVLAKLGRLMELRAATEDGDYVGLKPRGVQACCSPDGGQIYFVGGDQAIDLAAIGVTKQLPKDHVVIGECDYIEYHTTKDFHDFEPVDYHHQFGEETGELPTLCYDVLNQKLYLAGGAYKVKREGIVN